MSESDLQIQKTAGQATAAVLCILLTFSRGALARQIMSQASPGFVAELNAQVGLLDVALTREKAGQCGRPLPWLDKNHLQTLSHILCMHTTRSPC